jgi:hypothetical protein
MWGLLAFGLFHMHKRVAQGCKHCYAVLLNHQEEKMKVSRALIIKYVSDDNDKTMAFYMDRIGEIPAGEIMMTLCALAMQMGIAGGKTKDEIRQVLVETFDDLSEETFKKMMDEQNSHIH